MHKPNQTDMHKPNQTEMHKPNQTGVGVCAFLKIVIANC